MIRHVLALCILLLPTIALAQTSTNGPPVVFFSIFGPDGSALQRFYADVFEWKATASGGTIRYPWTEVRGRVVLGMFKDPAGNSVGLVEMENGKAKVPK